MQLAQQSKNERQPIFYKPKTLSMLSTFNQYIRLV